MYPVLPAERLCWLWCHPTRWPTSTLLSISFRSGKGRPASRPEHCNPSSLTNWKANEIISSSVLCRQEVVLQLSGSSVLIDAANRKNSLECPQLATGTKARTLWLLHRVEVTFSNKYNRTINSILWCAEQWNNPKVSRPSVVVSAYMWSHVHNSCNTQLREKTEFKYRCM